MLPPLKWIVKSSVRGSVGVGVAEYTATKGGGDDNVNMTVSMTGEITRGG